MKSAQIIYILECTHVMPGPTGVSETLCFTCDEIKRITDVHVYEWHAVCVTTKCTYSRWTGLAQMLANHLANAHAKTHPIHGVKVRYEINPVSEKVRKTLMEGTNGEANSPSANGKY
jgi:hypothetical protein